MTRNQRVSAEDVRASLWFWPLAAAAMSLALTIALLLLSPELGRSWAGWVWPRDVESARALLQVVATAIMTATTLTFSLTVVALQLASQQFSPRLLREFARDRLTQVVLALLISTFVVALTGLRGLQTGRAVPVLIVALVLVMGLASAGGLLVFVGHMVRALRVDTMMLAVHAETAAIIARNFVVHGDDSLRPRGDPPGAEGGALATSERSGFVRTVTPEILVDAAERHDVFIRLEVRPGDHVVAGTPIASIFAADGRPADRLTALTEALLRTVEIGFERTAEQDAALGFRQLTDIAVKAISPSINDPVTATHALAHCSDLLVRLQGRELGAREYRDRHGTPRLYTEGRDLRYYLDLVCAPVRRFGRGEPLVLAALLRMLRDCSVAARNDGQRDEIGRQVQFILDGMDETLLAVDLAAINDMAERVRLALRGQFGAAYRDRAGETRSI